MAAIFDTPALAMRRLEEIGIPLEALQRAVAAGHAARITTTANDAPQIPGTYAWGTTLRVLRDELCPRGWRKADPGNFSLVINDKRKINIVVESGDRFTRLAHASPRTKSLKGLYMEAVALRNQVENDMFPETLAEDLRRVAAIIGYPTYILLTHITDEQYRAELSRPKDMDGKQIVSWDERIFVPDSDDPFGERKPVPLETDDADIDIPVLRKA